MFDIKTVKKGNIIQPPNVENEIEQKNDKKNLKIALFCAILAVIVSIIFYIFISNNPKEFTFKYSDVNNELVYLKKIESTNDVVNYSNKLKKIKVNKLGFPEYVSPLSSMFFENQNEMLNVLSKLFDIIDNVYLLEITDTQYKYHIYSSVSKTESKIEDYFNELVKYRETKNIKPHNFSVVENKTKFALVNFNDFEIKISDNSTDNVHQCIIEISHVTNSENIK
ncbi:MAG: hypothetical protein MJ211_04130 [Bacteroidales bacterium]|nr:hypothetical protein [Bacteroidales bacterium]